jgi:phosphohistidine phosphatase
VLRSLYLLRHGKAEDAATAANDRARALKRRGVKAARAVGRLLTRLGEAPELVLSSDATRARETAEQAADEGGWKAPLVLRPTIYEAGAAALLAELRALETDARRILLVGHQPGLGLLISELIGSEPDFPTGALARVDLELARWKDAAPRVGRLAWLVTPELLGGE